MNDFYREIANSSAHKLSRETNSTTILSNPELFPQLFDVATDLDDEFHYKACRILELVAQQNIEWLEPKLDLFCDSLRQYKHDGALRSVSKICLFAFKHDTKKQLLGEKFLSPKQFQQIIEACFNWLIGDEKVASKAYSIRALFEAGKQSNWIYPELKAVLTKDFSAHSAAYKAVAKEMLPKLK